MTIITELGMCVQVVEKSLSCGDCLLDVDHVIPLFVCIAPFVDMVIAIVVEM